MSKVMKNEGLYIAILAGVVLVVAVLGTLAARQAPVFEQPSMTTTPRSSKPAPTEEPVVDENGFTREACEKVDGYWNECASACPNASPDEVCIEVCVSRCEFSR